MTARRRTVEAPEVRAAFLARQWAEQIGLPVGNYWEPAIARHALAEARKLGGDAYAWALTETIFRRQLGLEVRA